MRWLLVVPLVAACARQLPEPELRARCEEGLPQHCLDLGYACLDRGDVDAAVHWLDRACGMGWNPACGELEALRGTAWQSVPAVERSLALARSACTRGGPVACDLARDLELRSAALRAEEERTDAAFAEQVAQRSAGLSCGPGEGGLEKDDLKTVIVHHSADVRACYEARMWRDVSLALDVTASWSIDATGRVTKAELAKDTRPDTGVGECVRQAVLTWRFPPPRCGNTVNVTFPWLLRPAPEASD